MDRLVAAINFAAKAHRNQRRKDAAKTPYINHPIEVMNFLAQSGVTDVDTLCAAVLHDTVEDCGVTRAELEREFGANVANIVMECTDDKSLAKEIRKQQQIIHAVAASAGAKMVKCADKLSNLGDLDSNPPPKWSPDEIDGYFIWSYHVWLAARGHCINVDAKLHELFEKRGITKMANNELAAALDKYYRNIKNSE